MKPLRHTVYNALRTDPDAPGCAAVLQLLEHMDGTAEELRFSAGQDAPELLAVKVAVQELNLSYWNGDMYQITGFMNYTSSISIP